jgi:LPXTG-site transpeptidase (sortase) family protein
MAGEEALLTIPSLGIRLPILLGGQATIDRGLVTHYEASGWRAPVAAGAPGTYWLAAHHSTHGSPFANLPNIRAGALIVIDLMSGTEIRYQVTSAQVVGTSASDLTVYGPDRSTPRILLQTCEGGAYRLLVHGVRIS